MGRKPSLHKVHFGPLTLEVLGYQFPAISDYWDGNWLLVKITCILDSKSTKLTDSCLRVPELEDFLSKLETMHAGASKEAALDPIEPYIALCIQRSKDVDESIKVLRVEVVMNTSDVTEPTEFNFDVEEAALEQAIADLKSTLKFFPVRGT